MAILLILKIIIFIFSVGIIVIYPGFVNRTLESGRISRMFWHGIHLVDF